MPRHYEDVLRVLRELLTPPLPLIPSTIRPLLMVSSPSRCAFWYARGTEGL